MKCRVEKISDGSPTTVEMHTTVKSSEAEPNLPEMVTSNLKVPKTAVRSIKLPKSDSLSEVGSNKDGSNSQKLQLKRPGKFKIPSSAVLTERLPAKGPYALEQKNSDSMSNCSQQRVYVETDQNSDSLLGQASSCNRKTDGKRGSSFKFTNLSASKSFISNSKDMGKITDLFKKRRETVFLKTFSRQQSQDDTLTEVREEIKRLTIENILLQFEVDALGTNLLGRNKKPDFGKATRIELLSLNNTKKKYVEEIESIKSTLTELEVLISSKKEELTSKQKQRRLLTIKALECDDLDMIMKNRLKSMSELKAKNENAKKTIELNTSKLESCKRSLMEDTLREAELELGYIFADDGDFEVQALKSQADVLRALLLEKSKQ